MKNYLALCLMCKDEGHYLKEWCTYHFKLGVEHIYIYDNLSKVPLNTNPYVAHGISRGKITVINWPFNYVQGRHVRCQNDCLIKFGKKWQ